MSSIILLDAGPLGMITNPRSSPDNEECKTWLASRVRGGDRVLIPEIADYEVRRELIRADRAKGLARLDGACQVLAYLPIATMAMLKAAEFWAADQLVDFGEGKKCFQVVKVWIEGVVDPFAGINVAHARGSASDAQVFPLSDAGSGGGADDILRGGFGGNEGTMVTRSVLGCFCVVGAFAQGVSFQDVKRDWHIQLESYSIGLADFNGDGKMDVAVGAKDSIVVMLGDGKGEFPSKIVSPPLGGLPSGMAVGDFNGDGKPDVAISEVAGPVQVLLGKGDGTFQNPIGTSVGGLGYSLVAADFNRDGKLDLAVITSVDVWVLLGKGDGTFQTPVAYDTGGSGLAVVAVDFNGDAKLDLAVGMISGGYTFGVLEGNGDGTFGPVTKTSIPNVTWVGAMTVGDYNGDGKTDLALATLNEGAVVLLGNGNGTFAGGVSYPDGVGVNFGGGMVTADFNGDGISDLGIAGSPGVGVLLGKGDGTFRPPEVSVTGDGAVALAEGLIDGDGIPDVAVASANTLAASVLFGTGKGRFREARAEDVGQYPDVVVLGDFNQDGKLDYAVTHSSGLHVVTVGLGNGDGTFAAPQTSAAPFGDTMVVADFNNDGIPDLAISANPTHAFSILLGNGDGTFQSPKSYADPWPSGIAAGDFNGDGNMDLVILGRPETLWYLAGDGKGGFAAPVAIPLGYGGGDPIAGDFNGDGNLDVVVTGQEKVGVLLGNGKGGFSTPITSACACDGWMTVGDVNGDHILDLAMTTGTTRHGSTRVEVELGKGDGTFVPIFSKKVGPMEGRVAIGDLNRDGKADLAVTFNDGIVAVLAGNGDGKFQAPVPFPTRGAVSIAVGDFNGDGKPDLATIPDYFGYDPWLTILLNTTP